MYNVGGGLVYIYTPDSSAIRIWSLCNTGGGLVAGTGKYSRPNINSIAIPIQTFKLVAYCITTLESLYINVKYK